MRNADGLEVGSGAAEDRMNIPEWFGSSASAVADAVEELAVRCREARARLGVSQEEVAVRAGVTVSTYGCIERGRSIMGNPVNPTMDTLVRVFVVLGIEASLHTRDSSGGTVGQSTP